MKVAITQPYFFPYLNYYKLANLADVFILLDDVNYIKRGFINRNTIISQGKNYRFTIPVVNISQNRTINHHEYTKQSDKFLALLKYSYRNAPQYREVFSLITEVLNPTRLNVAKKNCNSIEYVFNYLGLKKNCIFL